MSNSRQIDRVTGFLLPSSMDEWLSERHFALFVVEMIEKLDLSRMTCAYRGSGSASYHLAMLYLSEANVGQCETAKIVLLISLGHEQHHLGWKERFGKAPPPLPENPSSMEAWHIDWRQEKANGCMPCASRYRNQCSVSSNR